MVEPTREPIRSDRRRNDRIIGQVTRFAVQRTGPTTFELPRNDKVCKGINSCSRDIRIIG